MKGFGFQILIVLFFFALGWTAHWALFSLNSEPARVSFEEPQLQFESEINNELKDLTAVEEKNTDTTKDTTNENKVSTYPQQDLIDRLQKLIDDVVYMKKGSRGTRVGIVQEFLNIFEGKDSNANIDNDYGNATKSNIASFQKSQNITSDGEAGPKTYLKMIEWLKTQS